APRSGRYGTFHARATAARRRETQQICVPDQRALQKLTRAWDRTLGYRTFAVRQVPGVGKNMPTVRVVRRRQVSGRIRGHFKPPPPAPPRSGEGRKISFSPLPASGRGRGRGFGTASKPRAAKSGHESNELQIISHRPRIAH